MRSRNVRTVGALVALLVATTLAAGPVAAHDEVADSGWTHDSWRSLLASPAAPVSLPAVDHADDQHSANMVELTRVPIAISTNVLAEGSDLAFEDRLVIAGSYQGTAIFRSFPKKPYFRQIGFHACPGSQGDVPVWGRFVFVSIDSPGSNSVETDVCNNTDQSRGKEGIRIIDIANPRRPRQIKFVETHCGSHTHTLVPKGTNMYLYVSSYPLGAPTATCNTASHQKISVLQFPKKDPTKATIVSTPDVSPGAATTPIGCHDITVYPSKNLAVAACITESQIWDITNPASPIILSRIVNEDIQIHHSSAFTWDGKLVALGDEFAGAAAPAADGCTGNQNSTTGAMWFYDITDRTSPRHLGHYALPRRPAVPGDQDEADYKRCTTHNFNIIPMRDPNRYVAVSSYYQGGVSVVDFSDPANPKELGYYLPRPGGSEPDTWSAYWYDGRIITNDHASRHGIRGMRIKGTGYKYARYFAGRLNPQVQIPLFSK